MANINQQQNKPKQDDVVIAMVPFPAQGHLNQLLHLSRLILSYDNIPVHYLASSTHNRQAKHRVHGWDPHANNNIKFHDLEVPPFVSPPPNPSLKVKFPSHLQPSFDAATTVHLRGLVADLLRSLACNARKVIVIYDSLMGYVIQDVAFISNVEAYTFHSVSAFACFLYVWEKIGNSLLDCELINKEIPSDENIPSLEGCFSDEFLNFMSSQYVHLKFNSGNIYNTSRIIEGTYMKLMELDHTISGSNKHWALGPFNPVTTAGNLALGQHRCLEWLDKKPPNSVVYVSFGTTTALSDEQIKEIAIGLKQSDKNFIWESNPRVFRDPE
ncbi:hypothetical protein ACFE04_014007 [Oxalis oulophora]